MSIYFAKLVGQNIVKIGFSRSPDERMVALKTKLGNLRIIRLIDGTILQERWLHRKFADRRIGGELFVFTKEMMTIVPPSKQEIESENYKVGFLGLSLPESLIEVIRHRAAKNRRSISAECRPALEDEFLSPDAIKPRLEDKQKTGKLRK